MIVDLYAAGGRDNAYQEKINIAWWFKELMLSYKFGEKGRYEKALQVLRPFLCDELLDFYEDIHRDSLWLNPITGKKGF